MTDHAAKRRDPNVTAYWACDGLPGVEFFKAEFLEHSFAKHSHEEFGIGVIVDGHQSFNHEGSHFIAGPGSIITVNPDEVHDGTPAEETGYRYRMAYIEPDLFQEVMRDLSGREGTDKELLPFFKEPVVHDPSLAQLLYQSHCMCDALFAAEGESLQRESIMTAVLNQLTQRHGMHQPRNPNDRRAPGAIARAVDYLQSHFDEDVSLDDVAAVSGLSRYHFLRQFKATKGMTPHAYLNQIRMKRARHLLRETGDIAGTAYAVGFCDQAHLTRRFKQAYAVTPGQFVKGVRG